jgi:DNA polymerase III alpha subunit
MIEWGKEYGLKTVATNDVHFLNKQTMSRTTS